MNELLYAVLQATGHDINAMKAKQNLKPPFVVYTPISEEIENCGSGITDLVEVNYQVDVYSVSYTECKSIMNDIIDAIVAAKSFNSVVYTITDTNEDDGKVYRSRLDLNTWANIN